VFRVRRHWIRPSNNQHNPNEEFIPRRASDVLAKAEFRAGRFALLGPRDRQLLKIRNYMLRRRANQ
jgi:hypothetical protein